MMDLLKSFIKGDGLPPLKDILPVADEALYTKMATILEQDRQQTGAGNIFIKITPNAGSNNPLCQLVFVHFDKNAEGLSTGSRIRFYDKKIDLLQFILEGIEGESPILSMALKAAGGMNKISATLYSKINDSMSVDQFLIARPDFSEKKLSMHLCQVQKTDFTGNLLKKISFSDLEF